mmetsp:Transcript_6737/g.7050  ORF Transcript_6737/g.7050 Transcript_6737/m.7050 type:complete len:358 (-) Transcript_6737:1325-2398(-)|eukprot:CAMPEP_0174818798 /NCGR_PEP_ID=MMETSP1107-20130205/1688_1 /TAXON_ID=36770 /ORGANISM="Paraphysomonas vestita, Strain GFlagA" /LENGTH=357 /DNA_ID=CAMNT_0016031209 /DNA_START=55 /DNA_END=1128 /DNA_ORIENTATION=+
MGDRKTSSTVSSSPVIKNRNEIKDKPKAGANRGKEIQPIDSEAERKKEKVEKLAARSAGKRKDTNKNDDNDRTAKGTKKKKKKKSPDEKKTFKPKKPKQNPILKFFLPQSDVVLRDPRAIEAADALRLTQRHLRKLREKFDQIDIDGSGNIDVDEFFEACGENKSPITDRLFAAIDLDGSGTIEFDEYVRIMATYCMYTKDEILKFCFETFDKDGSNGIDEKEFIELCKLVNNANPTFAGNFKRALEDFDVNDDGLINYSEFCELERRYPLILFPAFRLQDSLQRASLGESTWLKIIERYNEEKRREEYKATHGGKPPPDPFATKILKSIFPCFFHERVHVKLGADMEARHRAMNAP